MRATLAILILIALGLPRSLQAAPRREDPVREAARLHQQARQAMRALEFEDALPLLRKAAGLPGLDSRTRAELQADLGITYVNLGDTAKARASFERALEADPLLELPARTPPKVRQLYDSVRSERAAAAASAERADAAASSGDALLTAAPPPRDTTLPLVFAGAAAATLAVGIITGTSSASAASELGAEPHERETVDSLRSRQKTMGVISVVSYSLAAVAAGSAAAAYFWPRPGDRPPALSGVATREGALVFLTFGF